MKDTLIFKSEEEYFNYIEVQQNYNDLDNRVVIRDYDQQKECFATFEDGKSLKAVIKMMEAELRKNNILECAELLKNQLENGIKKIDYTEGNGCFFDFEDVENCGCYACVTMDKN